MADCGGNRASWRRSGSTPHVSSGALSCFHTTTSILTWITSAGTPVDTRMRMSASWNGLHDGNGVVWLYCPLSVWGLRCADALYPRPQVSPRNQWSYLRSRQKRKARTNDSARESRPRRCDTFSTASGVIDQCILHQRPAPWVGATLRAPARTGALMAARYV